MPEAAITLEDDVIHVRGSGFSGSLRLLMQQDGTRGTRASSHKVHVAEEGNETYAPGDIDWEERCAFVDGTVAVRLVTWDERSEFASEVFHRG